MELKPCPFCGAEAETRFYPLSFLGRENRANFTISCKKCCISKSIEISEKAFTFNDVFIAIEQCENEWNQRFNPDITL